jgi:hypothetical protein
MNETLFTYQGQKMSENFSAETEVHVVGTSWSSFAASRVPAADDAGDDFE